MSDSDRDDAFVVAVPMSKVKIAAAPAAGSSKTPPTPASAKKRKSATPTSGKNGGSKKKKQEEDADGEEGEPTVRFCQPDSDDEDEELTTRRKWAIVEKKVDGKRFSPAPPTQPDHRYIGRKIQIREDKPIPTWWKIAKVLQTERRMSNKPEDVTDSPLRQLYFKLGAEEEMDEGSQQSQPLSQLTPLTPEIIPPKNLILTTEIRARAEEEIRKAGKEGLEIVGTTLRVVCMPPNTAKKRPWELFAVRDVTSYHYICTAKSNCLRYHGTTVNQNPKCSVHKGRKVGFVLPEFTDAANKKNEVVMHAIASFTFEDADEQEKEDNATKALGVPVLGMNQTYGWPLYKQEREQLGKPTPQLLEIKERRRYFINDEDLMLAENELMKVYAARQTTTLFTMLLWPDTTIKIICLNLMINLPNGAYREFVEEMDLHGLELKIHDKIIPDTAKKLQGSEIPFLLKANKIETIGSLLKRGKELKKGKVAALYFVASPFVIYAGQALKLNVHTEKQHLSDPVIDYKNNKGDHPNPLLVPIGIVLAEDRYKWEFILQMSALIHSLLRLPNRINPEIFVGQSHPICINRQANSTYLDKNSWEIIHNYLMKHFLVDVFLGPKGH
ncbi:uncharacterized protein LOC118435998 isoform X1 [Folsomia candida]|nr:uncharacterized protein LOC118435998 isoform X1 [Folsomia candida]